MATGSVGGRAFGVSDLQEADLAEIDVCEGMRDEGIQALVFDPDVEDRSAARRDDDGLDALLRRAGEVGKGKGTPRAELLLTAAIWATIRFLFQPP